jgi:hypothetical protein
VISLQNVDLLLIFECNPMLKRSMQDAIFGIGFPHVIAFYCHLVARPGA